MNFVILDSDRHHLAEISLQTVPRFFESSEFIDRAEICRSADGILLSTFTRYMERIFKQGNVTEQQSCLSLIERLSGSQDPEVVNYVHTEIFENLRAENDEVERLVRRFGPRTAEAYADWLRRQPNNPPSDE